MTPEEKLGLELRYVRRRKGWTQETLGFESGIDRNYVSLVELGRNSPSLKIFFRLCKALGVSPSAMLRSIETADESALIAAEPFPGPWPPDSLPNAKKKG